ncbi:SGNH/GDSL hydrolase family protein [Aeromicrobium ginsengisoli]|uniref:SGNH/GDSL hydrolase family protein n=1 Tax=Aeromicrobium ginsengisoli TaxID=363867 RepID=A0A5M4FK60_9ACTN|nr:SGNH/GDSL hydrolase family protein [Aeromicrobium ginsengisoli]KAA1400338.1 SGNH/GDSL hydrolase family protein [Aeromicrobium ginsengisoli]
MFSRYVAIGDSLTEGLGDDPWPDDVPRGWADRLAQHLTDQAGQPVHYANLAVRGQKAAQVRASQLPAALAADPDLVTVTAGMNDLMRPTVDIDAVGDDLDHMARSLTDQGIVTVLVPLPDMTGLLPIGARLKGRVDALNDTLADVAARRGAILAPLPPREVFGQPQAWSSDRLHLSSLGHSRFALAMLHTLGLPTDSAWDEPLVPGPKPPAVRRIVGEVRWWAGFAGPWIGRRLRGRSSGDGRTGKRLTLEPWAIDE